MIILPLMHQYTEAGLAPDAPDDDYAIDEADEDGEDDDWEDEEDELSRLDEAEDEDDENLTTNRGTTRLPDSREHHVERASPQTQVQT